MGYKEVRDAIQTQISNNLTEVDNTSYIVHKRTPESFIDAQGYNIVVTPPNSVFGKSSTNQCVDTQTWFIDVYSPNAGTSYRSEHEDRLLEYAERIVTLFTDVRTLSLTNVRGIELGTLRFPDADFPVNSNATKYHFQLTLIVTYSRARAG